MIYFPSMKGQAQRLASAMALLLAGVSCSDASPAATAGAPPFEAGGPAAPGAPAGPDGETPGAPADGAPANGDAPAPTGGDAPANAAANEGAPPVQAPPAPVETAPSAGESAGMTTPPADDAPAGDEPAADPPAEPPSEPPAPEFPESAGKPTVYLTGDSTVQTYGAAQAPQQGWGQRIQEFFTDDVVFVNKAIGGRSSKSYIDEGRLDEVVSSLQRGDYLFAQWGINDRYRSDPTRFTDPSTTFKQYLQMYIDGARSKDAIPVLVTPTPRLDFSNGAFQNDFPEYCAAIHELGADTNTPVIDLQTRGLAFYTSIGLDEVEASISLDVLHFKVEGAFHMARLVSEGVKDSVLPIRQFVK